LAEVVDATFSAPSTPVNSRSRGHVLGFFFCEEASDKLHTQETGVRKLELSSNLFLMKILHIVAVCLNGRIQSKPRQPVSEAWKQGGLMFTPK